MTETNEVTPFTIDEAIKYKLKYLSTSFAHQSLVLDRLVKEAREDLAATQDDYNDTLKDLQDDASENGKYVVTKVDIDNGVIERKLKNG